MSDAEELYKKAMIALGHVQSMRDELGSMSRLVCVHKHLSSLRAKADAAWDELRDIADTDPPDGAI